MQLSPGSLSAGTVGLAEPGLRHGGIAQTWEHYVHLFLRCGGKRIPARIAARDKQRRCD
jgi:hypothetical protein